VGLFERLDTDWLLLDCELMPWSAKAQELLRRQYAAVGASATAALGEAIGALERTIAERLDADPADSYTARLLTNANLREEKVREEAEEVARAALHEPDERVAEEAADVLYHLAVLLAARGLSLADAFTVLNERRR
jgi:phosphoribosyl-ATP pyrophosphohydrolase/phosphoribosyl-AMP cyclohydrolase